MAERGRGAGQVSSETGIPTGLNRIKTRRLEPKDRSYSRAAVESNESPSYGASRPHLKQNQRAATAGKTRVGISSPREGSPVLGYLAAGILIAPHGLSIIRHVHGTKAIAEFGVVFQLFNIGLELSVERLSSMKKYVFGLGTAQVLVTAVVVGLVTHVVAALPGPAAIVIGNGLALSSTVVVLQVLQERGESTSRHGRASFSVLLFQAVFVPQPDSINDTSYFVSRYNSDGAQDDEDCDDSTSVISEPFSNSSLNASSKDG